MADTVTARVEHSWSGRIGPMDCHMSEEKDCASVLVWEAVGWTGFTRGETGAGGAVGERVAKEVAEVAEWTGPARERRVRVKSCFGARRPARPPRAGSAGGERERERGGGSRDGVRSHRGALGDGRGEGEGERGGGGGGDGGDGEGGGDAAARRFCPRRSAPVAAAERAHAACMRARRPRSPACSRHAARA